MGYSSISHKVESIEAVGERLLNIKERDLLHRLHCRNSATFKCLENIKFVFNPGDAAG
jgi:hypothetical protein